MHLPDGFLEPEVWIPLGAASAAGVGLALRKLSREGNADAGRAPVVGLAAAFVFAAQMVNFPVAAAVSGHFVGSVFLAILLGPWMALLVMASVLILQAFLFQDGGVTALGANIFNLAIVANFAGYGIYRLLAGKGRGTPEADGFVTLSSPVFGRRKMVAAFLAAWLATILAALAVAVELAPSGVAGMARLLLLLGGTHAVIGLAEAIITVAILRALYRMGMGDRITLQRSSWTT